MEEQLAQKGGTGCLRGQIASLRPALHAQPSGRQGTAQAMAKQPFSMRAPLQDRACPDHSLLGHSAEASRRGTTSDQLARAGFFRGRRCQCHSASARDLGGGPAGDGHLLCGLSFEQWACQCFTKTPSPSEQPSNTDDSNISVAFNCFHISAIVSVDNTLWGLLRRFQKRLFRASLGVM